MENMREPKHRVALMAIVERTMVMESVLSKGSSELQVIGEQEFPIKE